MIAVDSLERFLDRSMIDLWKNAPRGHILISTPRRYGSGDGTIRLNADWQYEGSYRDQYRSHHQFDREDRHEADDVVPDYLNMLASRGFFVRQNGSSHKAELLVDRMSEEKLADILNSNGSVVSAADVRHKEFRRPVSGHHYTFSTRDLFTVGRKHRLSDEQILERIKAYNWVPAQ